MATQKSRYSITLDEEMFKEVENFRFEHRYQTRSQATVELMRLGLKALKKELQETEAKNAEKEDKSGE